MRRGWPVPDNKPQQSVFDDPALLDFGSKSQAGDMQSFDLKTGQGAQAYSRQQARSSLASKVKTTGEQSAEDISATAKEIYGPLYEPGETIQRNAAMYALPYQAASLGGMPLKQAVKTAAGSLAGGMAGAYAGGHGGHYLGGIPGRVMNSPKLEKQGAGIGEGIGAVGGGLVGGMTGGMAGAGGRVPLRMRLAGIPMEAEVGGEAGAATAAPSMSGGGAQPRGQLIVTPQQQAEDVGRFYAGGSPGGGGPGGPNPYVTEENQRLIRRLGGGEDAMEAARRGAPGESPASKSLRRKLQTTSKKPWNQ
jgi:hypothetical protein